MRQQWQPVMTDRPNEHSCGECYSVSGLTTSYVAVSVKLWKDAFVGIVWCPESGTFKCIGQQQPKAQEMRKYWTPLGLNQVQHYVWVFSFQWNPLWRVVWSTREIDNTFTEISGTHPPTHLLHSIWSYKQSGGTEGWAAQSHIGCEWRNCLLKQ